jgi:hypothetical protein
MPPSFNLDEPYFRIRLTGSEESFPSLLEVSSFLYDFNLLYEISRLATDPTYRDFRFSRFVFYRRGRPLEERDRLYLQSLSLGSPIVIVGVVTAMVTGIGGVWGIVQIVEKITNAPLNRRKLKAEVEKLERENQEAAALSPDLMPEGEEGFRKAIRIREAEHFYDNVAGRLERSSVRIKELEIEVVQPNRKRESQ